MRTEDLFEWMQRRHAISLAKKDGLPKPWTGDPILQNYRFCNVYRELDTVTQWVSKNWRKPHADDPYLWFAMVVARFINWPPTLQALGYPVPWVATPTGKGSSSVVFGSLVKAREEAGMQVYGGAYTISTNGRSMVKWKYIEEFVLEPLWVNREDITNLIQARAVSLADVHAHLINYQGLGSFMAAQVIADLKYVQLKKAPDWWTWAASGPGSRRGLNRVQCPTQAEGGERKDTPWKESVWLAKLQELHAEITPLVAAAKMPRVHAQDLQNCLCEFDKYERVQLGEGRPRSLYPGLA